MPTHLVTPGVVMLGTLPDSALDATLPMQPQTREPLIEHFVPLLQDGALSLRPLL